MNVKIVFFVILKCLSVIRFGLVISHLSSYFGKTRKLFADWGGAFDSFGFHQVGIYAEYH